MIDKALQEIAESRPSSQEEILQSLDRRRVVTPPAEPFVTARGWMPGFKRDAPAARAWLSKRWAELALRIGIEQRNMPVSKLLSVAQVSTRLQCASSTVRKLIADGRQNFFLGKFLGAI